MRVLLKIVVLWIWKNLANMDHLRQILELIDLLRSEHKSGTLSYWSKSGNTFYVEYIEISFLKKDRKIVIEQLKQIQQKKDFLFWANSTSGELFYEHNYNDIVYDFENQIKRPWIKTKYKIKKLDISE